LVRGFSRGIFDVWEVIIWRIIDIGRSRCASNSTILGCESVIKGGHRGKNGGALEEHVEERRNPEL
jgi:hypothetical protein